MKIIIIVAQVILLVIVAVFTLSADSKNLCQESSSFSGTFYEENPTYIDPVDDSSAWQFSSPEEQGMDSQLLNKGLKKLEKHKSLFCVLIVRNDTIVAEHYYNGSAADHSNNIHSASKSIYPALLAIAIEQAYIKSLDQKIQDFLPGYRFDGKKGDITIRHLMNMSSGISWREDFTEYKIQHKDDWVGAILDLGMRKAPGTSFYYCTGNTHLISAILTNATGMSTCEFAHKNLFEPLCIKAEHWGEDPAGINSGGYNLYMTPREMAGYALLYLNNGNFNGKQIIPEWIIKESVQKTWSVDDEFDYGELWWLRTLNGHDMYFGWGYGGQFMYVMPDLNIVMIITENTIDGHNNIEINSGKFISNYVIPSIKKK
ncbi:MAG: beta-lactamase family protein [Desulfobacterales bacterium]|nr:beta-lactamase family protein [Desulfobacterales bacterium]